MTRILKDIAAGPAFRLAPPPSARATREAPLVYTELEMADAVRQATLRGREQAAQEAESFVRGLGRSVESALEAISEALQGIEHRRGQLLEELSAEVVSLALQVARAVVGSEVELRPQSLEAVVRELLDELRDAERIHVRLAPATLELLREQGGAISDDRIRWVADATLDPADARVDSDRGGWDATVETRWRRIAEAVYAARNRVLQGDDAGDANASSPGEEAAA